MKRTRFFIRNPDSGEPWAYCGDMSDREALIRAFGYFVESEIHADFGGSEESQFQLEVMQKDMTDEEVAALPDM